MNSTILHTRLPLVAAPMAGGPTTVALAREAAKSGAFPFLAGGYKTAEKLAEEITELRASVDTFGVNLFVPSQSTVDPQSLVRYARELEEEALHYDLHIQPHTDMGDDFWPEKISLLLTDPVPVVSFTFGLPEKSIISAFHEVGSTVLATVTTVDESRAARAAGVDGLIVQGPRAGGHSATFDPSRTFSDVSTAQVVRQVKEKVDLPIIAAGGVDGPESIRENLDAGAQWVSVGTLLLDADEAGTSSLHRQALHDPRFTETVLTRAFTGRPARALRNGFTIRHDESAPNAYPAVHYLTWELRKAAAEASDLDRVHLWAGTGWRNARSQPVAEIIGWLSDGL
ncbi:nitronate monooxygenase [Actinomycetaceae bacterium WB03_NA08]|uniref:Propionate 3-nitronate monooxygenase n=1 Tax=Scrofimicrobium canadense TaxID=2652290 RepID=A0A6N7VVB9_9ACTO|nr:nitronate monooxygenase [Scrofimicrobium canadense]MSS84930.1 nitronate monooxygenase [Scrofimicrobium canadense]